MTLARMGSHGGMSPGKYAGMLYNMIMEHG